MPNIIKNNEWNKIGIDSLKLRIPIESVKIIDKSLLNYWSEVELATGEVDSSTYKLKAKHLESNGIKTKYLLCRGNKIMQECVAILFNSKLLKEKYLEGINSNNIKQVYNSLMAQHIIEMPIETFLGGLCSDVDIKTDIVLSEGFAGQKSAFERLRDITLPTANKRGGYDIRLQKTNCGIQWSKREVSSHTYPYIKIYAKDLEMIYNSNEFFKHHIRIIPEGLTRVEGTIKNRRHFNSLYSNSAEFTLSNLLSESPKTHLNTLQIMAHKHLKLKNKKEASKNKSKNKNGKSLSDMFASCLLEEIGSLPLAIDAIYNHASGPDQRWLGKKKLIEIWQENGEIEKPQNHKSVDQLLEVLGVGEI